jgi:hypothetical protein
MLTEGVSTVDGSFPVDLLVTAWLALGALTVAGARRRGQRRLLALVTGLFFPMAWTVWYLIDEHRTGKADGPHVHMISK